MPVALPERTVDAWVTAYLVQRVPAMLLWAPTQRQIPDYDLASALPGPGKLFVFENKAPYTNGGYSFEIPVRQMWNYLRLPALRDRTSYVLPCPPYPIAEVPNAPGAPAPLAVDLIPARARSRLAGHPWPPSTGCEDWFRVVHVKVLWTHLLPGAAAPGPGSPPWPTRTAGPRPAGAPLIDVVPLDCPLPAGLGQTLRSFMDDLLRCERPELRIDADSRLRFFDENRETQDSPLYQALLAFAPAADLPGWK